MTGDWLETDFAAWFRYHDPEAGHRQVTLDELVDGELATIHAQLVDGGSPPKAAAKYLAGWFGGMAGRSLGFAVLGLWAEIGDGLGGPLAFQSELPVTPEAVARLERLVAADAAPWKARPALWIADDVCVLRKGGCCRAYTVEGGMCTNCPLHEDCEGAQLAWARSQR